MTHPTHKILSSRKFPRITRKFSATVFHGLTFLALSGFLTILFIVNGVSVSKLPISPKGIFALQQMPFNVTLHLELAQHYWLQGMRSRARDEVAIAKEAQSLRPHSSTSQNVLGETTSPDVLLSRWESDTSDKEKNLTYWKSVIAEHPEYRDAYIQAAKLAFELSRFEEAKNLTTAALGIDPNSLVGLGLSAQIADEVSSVN